MMEFEKIVISTFERIIKKYNLQATLVSPNEMILFSDKYILSFLFHSAELDMVYIEKKANGELYQYNIDSFIAYSISEEDRLQVKEKLKSNSKIEKELELLACTLENKWDELLSGGTEWISEYQDFVLYIPPRNITKLKGKIYVDTKAIK